MAKEIFTAFITKYALTVGVYKANVEIDLASASKGTIVTDIGQRWTSHYHKPHWHRTAEEAVAQVKKVVAAKRKSIAKQLAPLDDIEKKLSQGKLPMRMDGI